jgi:hypothetical protein
MVFFCVPEGEFRNYFLPKIAPEFRAGHNWASTLGTAIYIDTQETKQRPTSTRAAFKIQ